MKKCKHCGISQDPAFYETPRTRICNECKDLMATKQPDTPPEQKMSDEEMVALWKKSNSPTVIKPVEEVYEPSEVLHPTGRPIERNDRGDRIYQNLNKVMYTSAVGDLSVCDFGGSESSSGSE